MENSFITVTGKMQSLLHYTDVPSEEHRTIEVTTSVQSEVEKGVSSELINCGDFSVDTNFVLFTLLRDLLKILKKKKQQSATLLSAVNTANYQTEEDTEPLNILELSPEGYSEYCKYTFPDGGTAVQTLTVSRQADGQYKSLGKTIHKYSKEMCEDIVKMLPMDLPIINAGNGMLAGTTQVHWLKSDGSYLSANLQVAITLQDSSLQLPKPQLFSFNYIHGTSVGFPFELKVTGEVSVFDLPVIDPEPEPEEEPEHNINNK